jgi:hypothetical protein
MSKGIIKKIADFFWGKDKPEPQSVAQNLQGAVQRELELASLKETTATTAMSAALTYRKELEKLVIQSQELHKMALKAQSAGEDQKAKKILAMKLAIDEKIASQTEAYTRANEMAKTAIVSAKTQYKKAHEASQDMPRKVLQLEINTMTERSQAFEKETMAQMAGKQGYKALADSIDLKSMQLSARALIEESSDPSVDQEVNKVLLEGKFDQEYQRLKIEAKDYVETSFIEDRSNAASEAYKALSLPPFDGILGK